MSDKIDADPVEKEKDQSEVISLPSSPEATVSNGLENEKPEPSSSSSKTEESTSEDINSEKLEIVSSSKKSDLESTVVEIPSSRSKSRKSSLSKDPESPSEKMTNKDVPPKPLKRSRMRSRSKSSNSEDLKSEKAPCESSVKKDPESSDKSSPRADVQSLSKSNNFEDLKLEKDLEESSLNKPSQEFSADSPSKSDEPLAESQNCPLDVKNEKENEDKLSLDDVMEVDDSEGQSADKGDDSGPFESISTPMIVEDDNSSDFLGFNNPEDKYSAFSIVLRPYEEVPSTKKSSQNGPVSSLSKFLSVPQRITPIRSSPSSKIDINDPEFKKPFDYGWRRELVFRSTNENSMRRNADVYYYTPLNKKVRSLREVLEHLIPGEGLSAENFTFCKESLGVNDPEKEIIREANWKPSRPSEDGFYTLPVKKTTPKSKAPPKRKEKKEIVKEPPIEIVSPSSSPGTSATSPLTPRIVMKTKPGFKVNSKKMNLKVEKRRKAAGPDDSSPLDPMDDWCPEPKAQTNGLKRGGSDTGSGSDGSPPSKMSAVSPKSTPSVRAVSMPKSAPKVEPSSPTGPLPIVSTAPLKRHTTDFMNMFNSGYIGLLHAFQYLKVHELLRAACVCKMWRHLASHRSLWEYVHMKNSRVRNWEGFAQALRANGTRGLDLKKMLVPDNSDAISEMWKNIIASIKAVPTLTKIDLGRCTPENVDMVVKACPQIESIAALSIRGQSIDLNIFKIERLVELKLKSVGGMDLNNFSVLKKLTNLKHLSLTSVKRLIGIENNLPLSLETLELGECCQLNESFATEALPKLKSLKRLRLEKGQGQICPTIQIINTISNLENLSQLELINFDIKPGFDKALSKCAHVRTLLIIPTYVTQSATTNHVVMGGVTKLSATLQYFIWGLTLELLRVTDLFIDQVEGQKQKAQAKKGAGDSIPILKPLSDESAEPSREGQTTSQVDILALPKLQRVLSTLLPTTRIKILKVPFSATWRQIVD